MSRRRCCCGPALCPKGACVDLSSTVTGGTNYGFNGVCCIQDGTITVAGAGPYTLFSGGDCTWLTGCLPISWSSASPPGSGSSLKIKWSADGALTWFLYSDGACATINNTVGSNATDVIAVNRSGFSITWLAPVWVGGRGTVVLTATPFSGACNLFFTVKGCNSLALSGATVDIWTSSAKTTHIGTCTTNGAGECSVNIGNNDVSLYYEIAKTRFVTSSASTIVSPGTTIAVSLAPASGYHCLSSTTCAWPLKDTLNYTDGITSTTLVWNSTGTGTWAKRTTVPYTGYSGVGCSCPNITTFMNYELHAGGAIGAICDSGSWVSGSGDPIYSGCCPNHNGGGTCEGFIPTGTVTSLTCPESGALLITGTLPMGPEGGGPDCCGSVGSLFPTGMVYGCSPSSYTITE